MKPNNPNPEFNKPKHHKARPAFLRACFTTLTKRPASSWDGWALIHHVYGKSRLNIHAAKSLDALCLAIAHFVDINSGVVNANVTQLAELTGLITQSKKGNVSISRASRAVNRLIKAGLLEGEIVWDKELGCWLPKFINVTDKFWQLAHPEGIEGYNKAREAQFAYQNQGLKNENEWLTVTEAKERRRIKHTKEAFERRQKQHIQSKARRKAKELASKNKVVARSEIAKQILDELDTCHGLDVEEFSSMINKRTALYRKMSEDPPPQHKKAS